MPVPRNEFMSPVWRDGLFDGKVLFCTGGAGSICSAQVRAFVALGGDACIIGRNVQKTENGAKDIATVRKGAKVLGIGAVDVRDPDQLQKAADRCVRELGSIDFAIAGAAGNFLAPISQLSPKGFKTVVDIDTLGSYNTAKAVLPYLVESAARNKNISEHNPSGTGGRIIFVSASFTFTGKFTQTHAAAAKAAVDQISHGVAIEYGPLGVTSNIVTPGPIGGTEGMDRLSESSDRSNFTRKIPLQRLGAVREIADATVYLFSEAGSYVNGNNLVVDGGQWRVSGAGDGYPDDILSGRLITAIKNPWQEKKNAKL